MLKIALRKNAIDQLAGIISADTMQQMNYQVDEQYYPVEEVIRKFLAE